MPEIVWPWLLASHGPGQRGLVPDAAEYLPDCCRADLVAGSGDEKRAARGEMRARCSVARVEDLDDLVGQRQPAAAMALGPDDVDMPGIEVDLSGLQSAGFAGPQPARVHQGEERDCLPSPRAWRLYLCGGGEEQLDLMPGQQIGTSGNDRGFPPVGEHVSLRDPVHRHPAADVTDIGHPGPVAATTLQMNTDPAFNGVLVEHRAVMGGAVGVELFQVPDAGGASESHVRLERQIGVQLGGERAGEAVATHDRTASGVGRTQSSRRCRSTLM